MHIRNKLLDVQCVDLANDHVYCGISVYGKLLFFLCYLTCIHYSCLCILTSLVYLVPYLYFFWFNC